MTDQTRYLGEIPATHRRRIFETDKGKFVTVAPIITWASVPCFACHPSWTYEMPRESALGCGCDNCQGDPIRFVRYESYEPHDEPHLLVKLDGTGKVISYWATVDSMMPPHGFTLFHTVLKAESRSGEVMTNGGRIVAPCPGEDWAVPLPCPADTDGDGDCALCAHSAYPYMHGFDDSPTEYPAQSFS